MLNTAKRVLVALDRAFDDNGPWRWILGGLLGTVVVPGLVRLLWWN
jgi:hypothetical protein